MLELYFPIVSTYINVLAVIVLGLFTGVFSGLFGFGGGLVVVPFLTLFGVPTTIAVATSVNQMTAGTLSSFLTYSKMNRVDYKMSVCLIIGGFLGTIIGYSLLKMVLASGKGDLIVSTCFLVMILLVAISTSRDAIRILKKEEKILKKLKIISCLPFKTSFVSHISATSVIPFILVGIIGGILSILLGIGGGFVMVPILLYLLGVKESHISGSVQLQMFATSIVSSILYAYQSVQVDIFLSSILIIGTVIGARYGAKIGRKLTPDTYRLLLSVLFISIAIFMLKNLYTTHVHYKNTNSYDVSLSLAEQKEESNFVEMAVPLEQKGLHFNLKIVSNAQYIKDLIKQHPHLYATIVISIALIFGFMAGRLRNGAKQH